MYLWRRSWCRSFLSVLSLVLVGELRHSLTSALSTITAVFCIIIFTLVLVGCSFASRFFLARGTVGVSFAGGWSLLEHRHSFVLYYYLTLHRVL